MLEFKNLSDSLIAELKQGIENYGLEELRYEDIEILMSTGPKDEDFFEYGIHFYLLFKKHLIGEVSARIVRKSFESKESAFWFFDDYSVIDAEAWLDVLSEKNPHKGNILNGSFAYIDEINIYPQLRGLGLGSELLKTFESLVKSLKLKSVYLVSYLSEDSDCVPHQFYIKNGYQIIGSLKNDNTCQVMYKNLR